METISGDDDVIYCCEYLLIDSEDMVQVLQVLHHESHCV